MAVIKTRSNGGTNEKEFMPLPTDVYQMEIAEARIEENQYAEPRKDGTKPEQLVITWEVSRVSEDQGEAGVLGGEKVWQRLNPYYGPVRDGGDSRFKMFIDSLLRQGVLKDFDPDAFDTDSLIGIEQRVTVEEYVKTMGPNAGKPGNRVTSVMPLRKAKAQPSEQAAPTVQRATPRTNSPVNMGDPAEIPF